MRQRGGKHRSRRDRSRRGPGYRAKGFPGGIQIVYNRIDSTALPYSASCSSNALSVIWCPGSFMVAVVHGLETLCQSTLLASNIVFIPGTYLWGTCLIFLSLFIDGAS